MTAQADGSGTASDPWILTTPPGKSEFEAWRDEDSDPPALVVQVGTTQLRYRLRCVDDLHAMLKERGDWVPLGNADEQKPAAEGTVEAWGRSPGNPVGGWYGLKKGLRGRFGNYIPPVLEVLGLPEVEHNARNNRMRARCRASPRRARPTRRPPGSRGGARPTSCAGKRPLSGPASSEERRGAARPERRVAPAPAVLAGSARRRVALAGG